jgi:predicted transcriptional regulator
MDPILDKARAGENALERLMDSIPGFKGYRERDLRRDADRLQREHLAAQLDDVKKALNQVASAITRSGSLDAINDVETARKRLDKVANRIRYAERGYSGFFDAIKVEEAILARVYQFDMGLVEDVEGVRAAAAAAAQAAEPRASLQDLIGRIDALDARLSERENVLRGIK